MAAVDFLAEFAASSAAASGLNSATRDTMLREQLKVSVAGALNDAGINTVPQLCDALTIGVATMAASSGVHNSERRVAVVEAVWSAIRDDMQRVAPNNAAMINDAAWHSALNKMLVALYAERNDSADGIDWDGTQLVNNVKQRHADLAAEVEKLNCNLRNALRAQETLQRSKSELGRRTAADNARNIALWTAQIDRQRPVLERLAAELRDASVRADRIARNATANYPQDVTLQMYNTLLAECKARCATLDGGIGPANMFGVVVDVLRSTLDLPIGRADRRALINRVVQATIAAQHNNAAALSYILGATLDVIEQLEVEHNSTPLNSLKRLDREQIGAMVWSVAERVDHRACCVVQ